MSTFKFGPNSIRVVDLNGNPWFVAVDVCSTLFDPVKVQKAGAFQYTRHIASDERQIIQKNTLNRNQGNRQGCGGTATIISESGLYKLVMRSDKPEAKAFQDWVTREVLPAY